MPESTSYPWFERHWQALQNGIQQDCLSHALLLSGPSGAGILSFAQRLGESLLCSEVQPNGHACGFCGSCVLCQAGTHPDLQVLSAVDAAQITIDDIRQLKAFVELKSHYGRYKVVVIEPAEAMNQPAANSLLKTLEEPPPMTLFILVSYQVAALLVTIRSRCHPIQMQVSAAESQAWLASQLPSDVDVPTLLRLSHQGPLAALRMTESMHRIRPQLLSDLLAITQTRAHLQAPIQEKADPVAIASQWAQLEWRDVLNLLMHLVQDLIRLSLAPVAPTVVNRDVEAELKGLVDGVDCLRLFDAYAHLLDCQRLFDQRSTVNRQGLFETFLLHWSRA